MAAAGGPARATVGSPLFSSPSRVKNKLPLVKTSLPSGRRSYANPMLSNCHYL